MNDQPELPFDENIIVRKIQNELMKDILRLAWGDGQLVLDQGIEKAEKHANDEINGWSELAYAFLIDYAASTSEFMAEDVRSAARGLVPEPPSLRAWGGVIRRAAGQGIIKKVGCGPVDNPTSHCANANIWRSVV